MTEGELQDITLTCADCGKPFIFSIGEQLFYYSKQLSPPKRCKACLADRKSRIIPGTIKDWLRDIREAENAHSRT